MIPASAPQKVSEVGKIDYTPQKVEVKEEAKKVAKKPDSFFQAGVWDHKIMDNAKVKQYIQDYIDDHINENADFPIQLFSCNSFDGQLTTLISRGKAKIGFVYNTILWEWRGKRGTNLHRSQGVLHLYSLNDTDQDQYKTTCQMLNGDPKKFVKQDVQKQVGEYLDRIAKIHIDGFFSLTPKKKE